MARAPRTLSAQHFEVRPSGLPQAGLGLFSSVALRRGDTIGRYTGEVLTDTDTEQEPYLSSLYLVWVCRDHWIYGEGPLANHTRFINHCHTRPNARLVVSTRWKSARIEAIRAIRPGEEILYDYGPSYWEALGIAPAQGRHVA
jgi:uncharacterized protein